MVKDWPSMRKTLESIHNIDGKNRKERADCAAKHVWCTRGQPQVLVLSFTLIETGTFFTLFY